MIQVTRIKLLYITSRTILEEGRSYGRTVGLYGCGTVTRGWWCSSYGRTMGRWGCGTMTRGGGVVGRCDVGW